MIFREVLFLYNRLTVTDPKIIAVKGVNDALKTGDSSQTVRALANPALGLEQLIVPNGAPLYHTELDYIRRESRADLRFEVQAGLQWGTGLLNVL